MKSLIFICLAAALCLAALSVGCTRGAKPTEKVHPAWLKNAVMYELNTRQFTPQGTFAAATEQLVRLKELGVDVIWMMPIYPIGAAERKGTLGSYYAISDYKATNPEFGTMEEFRALVDRAHELGLRVILDWVANHTSPDSKWSENKDWYRLGEDGKFLVMFDWTDIAPLDFTDRNMRAAMIDAMEFWVREAKIDGYRCDVAHEVPVDFWEEAVPRLQAIDPEIFMLAEAEKPELNVRAFDAYYGWELHHIMNGIAQEKLKADTLWTFYKNHLKRFPEGAVSLNFTSNHDENSWNGTEFERMGEGARAMAALTWLVPGMPLIYNGQEVGLDRRLEFFEKDPIDWVDRGGFGEFYAALNRLKHSTSALDAGLPDSSFVKVGNDAPEQVFSFVRRNGDDMVLAVFNLSSASIETSLKTGAGSWKDYKDGSEFDGASPLTMDPWSFKIFVN